VLLALVQQLVKSTYTSESKRLTPASIPEEVLLSIATEINSIPSSVWNEIIDATKNQSAKEKLRKIATKTQDIVLR
jgi:hypothetical protein